MLEELEDQLNIQQQILVELEDELELEISSVIALKNKIEPEFIEELEKIEEGLYVEVKMINETKKNIDKMIKNFTDKKYESTGSEPANKDKLEKLEADAEKFKKRSEKLAKQVIEAHEEIEELNENMERELKKRESEIKNEVINKLKEKDRFVNEKLLHAQKREEEFLMEIETIKKTSGQEGDDVQRVKTFFDKKIKNIKDTMALEFKQREKEIVEKAIIVYNKKKEKIYHSAIKKILQLKNRSPEIGQLLNTLRTTLDLTDDVYNLVNFSLCENCAEVTHVSQSNCPNCNAVTH